MAQEYSEDRQNTRPLRAFFDRFRQDNCGAITVDFIVITAGIVILGGLIVGMTRDGQEKIAGDINVALSATPVN